ncbi:hypothetical protein BDV95DRAFT_274209 [Massariosphaeria phaeospora]|uniref:Uncharacterized protein n=1 Tax=Massariosphaeria phaeospora TaxID=100035 RepID=A0A7C8MRQ5_9PLEO|nr:hypothetical protein BDV95DRAFT_274209 [Massariosphaeria phaeospora]
MRRLPSSCGLLIPLRCPAGQAAPSRVGQTAGESAAGSTGPKSKGQLSRARWGQRAACGAQRERGWVEGEGVVVVVAGQIARFAWGGQRAQAGRRAGRRDTERMRGRRDEQEVIELDIEVSRRVSPECAEELRSQ